MTFACSRRSFAAMALAAGLVLPVAASAAGPRPSPSPGGGHHGSTSGGSQRPSTSRHQVSGILKGMPGTTMPTALTVLQADGTMINVIVPTTRLRAWTLKSMIRRAMKAVLVWNAPWATMRSPSANSSRLDGPP